MAQISIAGHTVEVNDEGYMLNPGEWNTDIAEGIAAEIGISLSDKHYEVLHYLREQFAAEVPLTVRKVGKSGIVDIKGLYTLFPGGPLKYSSKIAGIPKPASCV
jgi:dissimilatory sulfite reductase related protein